MTTQTPPATASATSDVIVWTRPMLDRFKIHYKDAECQKQKSFVFDGHDFDTRYAFYLIEHIENNSQKLVS